MSYTIRQEPHITGAGGDVEAVLKDLKRALALYLSERLEPSRP
jgi:predicted RNase H-like HicB family nuclease